MSSEEVLSHTASEASQAVRHLPLWSRGSCIWLGTGLRQSGSEPITLLMWLWMRSRKRTLFLPLRRPSRSGLSVAAFQHPCSASQRSHKPAILGHSHQQGESFIKAREGSLSCKE